MRAPIQTRCERELCVRLRRAVFCVWSARCLWRRGRGLDQGLESRRRRGGQVELCGVTLSLIGEAAGEGELMRVALPPISVSKSPKLSPKPGEPCPPSQHVAITFGAPITAESTQQSGLGERANAIALKGSPLSRLHGTRDRLVEEVREWTQASQEQ